MKKKIAACLFFLSLSGVLFGQDGPYRSGNFLLWGSGSGSAFEREATITGYDNGPATLSIPNILGEFPVVAIGDEAFRNKGLTSISRFPDGLKDIGKNAFAGNRLTNVNIPGGVQYISSGSFSENQLATVTFGNGV